jgi:hypothetical protein
MPQSATVSFEPHHLLASSQFQLASSKQPLCGFTVRDERPSTMAPIYPPFPVRESGHLQVSSIHSIYYEDCGIATGVPIIHLHGGPGEGKVHTYTSDYILVQLY